MYDILSNLPTNIALFADDTVLYAINGDILIAYNQIQEALNSFSTWSSQWRIVLNPLKTQAKIFTFFLFSSFLLPC